MEQHTRGRSRITQQRKMQDFFPAQQSNVSTSSEEAAKNHNAEFTTAPPTDMSRDKNQLQVAVKHEEALQSPGKDPLKTAANKLGGSRGGSKLVKFKIEIGRRKHMASGDSEHSILEACKTVVEIKRKIENQQHIWLYDKVKLGWVNLGMPLKCLPDEVTFTSKFRKANRSTQLDYRNIDSLSDYVLFHVEQNGRREGRKGNQPINILKIPGDEEMGDLCVFASSDETIEEALCRDGRFNLEGLEVNWNLIDSQNKDVVSCKQPVTTVQDKKLFLRGRKTALQTGGTSAFHDKQADPIRDRADPTSDQARGTVDTQEQPTGSGATGVSEGYCNFPMPPKIKIIVEIFKNKKNRERINNQKKLFRKERYMGIPTKVVEKCSGSVGYISWEQGCATCFHFGGGFIMTCYHVIMDIVGKDQPEMDNLLKTSVTFAYDENLDPNQFGVENRVECHSVTDELDYAVLKLRHEQAEISFPKALKLSESVPSSGLVYIIGHPDGKRKSVDSCYVFSFSDPTLEIIHRMTSLTLSDFRGPKIQYETCFYEGSSGSPVLNGEGEVVALHSAGYTTSEVGPFEYGASMSALLSDSDFREILNNAEGRSPEPMELD